ncbi:hypothetical protein B9Z19DRAFT_1088410 [Tuber borchii]|uniref:Uncharacterized protein n=1 Tax=Tuber borchii TaxID=42251 RepID=A0A2T6ZLI0_TUBBO|nr:hypothetical protein B9Z19DRAFT_1088410 [Tuber borchii]
MIYPDGIPILGRLTTPSAESAKSVPLLLLLVLVLSIHSFPLSPTMIPLCERRAGGHFRSCWWYIRAVRVGQL